MGAEETRSRDAVIFVPGFGQDAIDQRIDTIARKFAGALDRQLRQPEPKIKVVGSPDEEYGRVYQTPVRTIVMEKGGSDEVRPLVDIYELDYRENLSGRFTRRSPLSKALVMLSVILAVGPRFVRSLFHKGKTLRDQMQMLTMAGIMAAMVLYMGLLIYTGGATVVQQVLKTRGHTGVGQQQAVPGAGHGKVVPAAETVAAGQQGDAAENSTTPAVKAGQDEAAAEAVAGKKEGTSGEKKKGRADSGLKTGAEAADDSSISSFGPPWLWSKLPYLQTIILVLAALGLFSRKSFKDSISALATEYVCACNYLRLANRKPVILGQAAALLEHIAEKEETYRQVHIVAFSFGTLVALDVLFPHVRPGARLGTVHSLVTIGCPFDVVRTYWPDYFTGRSVRAVVPALWVNLYAPLDVFGSNFRNDTRKHDAEQGIELEADGEARQVLPTVNISYDIGIQSGQLNLFDILTIKGIRLHTSYWSKDSAPEVSCFDSVVGELYGNSLQSGLHDDT